MTRYALVTWTLLVPALLSSGLASRGEQPKTPPAAGKAKVVVGPNVQVSREKDSVHHDEPIIAADPADVSRLFAASMYYPSGGRQPRVVGYYSRDGGKTWRLSVERADDPEDWLADPTAAFGPDGSLNFAYLRYRVQDMPPKKPVEKEAKDLKIGDPNVHGLVVMSSADGGKAWAPATHVPPLKDLDRPWLAVDGTKTKYSGRLYGFAHTDRPLLYTSDDHGKTIDGPRLIKGGHGSPSNPVILTDGTLVAVYRTTVPPSGDDYVTSYVSTDGGRSTEEGGRVAKTFWLASNSYFPQLAADTASRTYKDGIYAVWADGGGREPGGGESGARILFSFSKDKGRSWSEPSALSGQAAAESGEGVAPFIPSVAVNKDGVVAVSWYDRRRTGKGDGKPAAGPPYELNVRLRISLDGGETWEPSVRVNEKTIKAWASELGHTAGLAADAGGVFHPVWIDDRTGKRQVWTAAVTVGRK
jgi:hypothetical protein